MKRAKRNVIIVTVLLFVCAAVYLNWTYNNRWGSADEAMVDAEDERMQQASAAEDGDAQMTVTSVYFAQARLGTALWLFWSRGLHPGPLPRIPSIRLWTP